MKIFLSLILLLSFLNASKFENETLLQTLPKDFKLAYKKYNKETHIRFLEFVPKNETLQAWTQMISTTIYYKNLNLSAEGFVQAFKKLWEKNCQGAYTRILPQGEENGYNFALIMLYCPKSKVTNKEEITWLKAIKGKDSFYAVQKSFSYNVQKTEIVDTMKYLKSTIVCDTREHNCPIN